MKKHFLLNNKAVDCIKIRKYFTHEKCDKGKRQVGNTPQKGFSNWRKTFAFQGPKHCYLLVGDIVHSVKMMCFGILSEISLKTCSPSINQLTKKDLIMNGVDLWHDTFFSTIILMLCCFTFLYRF